MSTPIQPPRHAAPGEKEPGRAAGLLLTVVSAAPLIPITIVALVLAAYERIRYGRHQCETEVYPGVLPDYTPSAFASLDENRST